MAGVSQKSLRELEDFSVDFPVLMCRRRRFPPSDKRIQRVCDCLEKADGRGVGNREQLHRLEELQIEHFECAIDVEAPRGVRIWRICV